MAMKTKNFWILLLCMLAGLTVGNFGGELCQNVSFLKWINYGQVFGLDRPVTVDLGVILFSLQISIRITLAGIIGMVSGIFVFKKI
ncbi:MAG: DUF4321 domain-containing protein [Cellulosilyticaceae bacterium]